MTECLKVGCKNLQDPPSRFCSQHRVLENDDIQYITITISKKRTMVPLHKVVKSFESKDFTPVVVRTNVSKRNSARIRRSYMSSRMVVLSGEERLHLEKVLGLPKSKKSPYWKMSHIFRKIAFVDGEED